jgi:hypothetical protein
LLVIGGLIVPITLRSAELAVAVVILSGSLYIMMLLPGITFILIVAFLTIAVVLNVRLVGSPFRLRL